MTGMLVAGAWESWIKQEKLTEVSTQAKLQVCWYSRGFGEKVPLLLGHTSLCSVHRGGVNFPAQSMAGLGSCVCCDFRGRNLPDYTAYLGSLAEVNAGSVIPIVITNINSHITYDTVPVKCLSVCLSLSYLLLFQDSCELQNKCKPKRP